MGSTLHPLNLPRHLTFFENCQTGQKNHLYYSLISRMPQFGAMWSKRKKGGSLQYSLGGVQPRDQPPIHSICPDISPFLELSNQPENSLFLLIFIENALVWCHVAQKQVGGSLQHSLGGVQPRDQPHIHLQCPDTSPFLELSNQPEKSLFLFTFIENALVWCHVVQKQVGGTLQCS